MKIEDHIWTTPTGGYRAEVQRGESAKGRRRARKRFPPGTPLAKVRTWVKQALGRLERQAAPMPAAATLAADIARYLLTGDVTTTTRKVRRQQLAWWAAQDATPSAPVLTPKQVRAGECGPAGRTLGDQARHRLDPARLSECLRVAFAPTDEDIDPTEFASTSNSYRTALFHLSTELDRHNIDAPRNPLTTVQVRPQKGAQPAGEDMRVVAEILKHVPSKWGRSGHVTQLRINVCAWVHITPKQMKQIDPARDFHDVPSATREEMIGGLITLTKRPRLKGRKNKPIPAPETIPLTPYGVAAMRAFAAEPKAWGKAAPPDGSQGCSVSMLNLRVKRAARRAQAALAAQGVTVDLSGFTLYHLKHSLASAASVASAGVMTRQGVIRQDPGVQKALDHTKGRTTEFYTQIAVDPIVRQVNAALSLYLDRLFKVPLRPSTLRIVPAGTTLSRIVAQGGR